MRPATDRPLQRRAHAVLPRRQVRPRPRSSSALPRRPLLLPSLLPVPLLVLLPLLVFLTACNDSSSTRNSTTRGKATVRADGPDAGPGSANTTGSRPSSGGPSGSPARCVTADLTASVPDTPEAGTAQRHARVIFTNRSARQCTLHGFPGTQLRTSGGEVWDLVRSTQVPATRIVLAPGAAAHATLSYLPLDPTQRDAVAFAPATLVLIPPDERTSLQVPWTRGPLLRQDGATHPGTYISALQPGA
ncbi:hypothetical protein CC117_24310 [Parafrankia colletiae]|uniref:DUF4232 domain-containing protein n=1 Tax=Parafrankia colletiae TaxID=573497 RepID=A0A1S1QHJ9_9ACTN|nr:DUF4232 domain-containing protein [Parafrankia colletiae]MCK9901970.1 DUF4232 domain-containing protein [Frankia sp. Cpl3]OHV32911.1 hypothetical protein CC117_24310 [Parafrankia colletiae]